MFSFEAFSSQNKVYLPSESNPFALCRRSRRYICTRHSLALAKQWVKPHWIKKIEQPRGERQPATGIEAESQKNAFSTFLVCADNLKAFFCDGADSPATQKNACVSAKLPLPKRQNQRFMPKLLTFFEAVAMIN